MTRHDHSGGDFDEHEDVLGETLDGQEGALDRRLRGLIGPVAPMVAPPYGFERVVMRARRRRQRRIMLTATAAVLGLAVASGGVLLGFRATGDTVQTAGCGNSALSGDVALSGNAVAAAPAGWVRGATMQRKYEWAIGGVLTAGALAGGIFAGCASGSSANQNTSTNGASSSPAPAQSNGGIVVPAPSSGSTGSASPSATGLPRCHTADLSPDVSLVAGSAGAGHEAMNLTLKNNSGHTCTIFGYPGMMLQDQNGAGQATSVVRTKGVPEKTLVVPDGGSVSTTVTFDFDMPGPGEPTTGNCEPQSYSLLITPPDETSQLTALITGGPVTVCQKGTLNVLPFISGTTGPNQ
jgi:hypothetical protein